MDAIERRGRQPPTTLHCPECDRLLRAGSSKPSFTYYYCIVRGCSFSVKIPRPIVDYLPDRRRTRKRVSVSNRPPRRVVLLGPTAEYSQAVAEHVVAVARQFAEVRATIEPPRRAGGGGVEFRGGRGGISGGRR